MVYIFIPFMFLPVYASVEKLDRSLVRASQDLGANPMQTFLRVILPLTLPGIVGGSIIVFIPALGNFVVPAVLGGAKVLMLGNLVEQQFLSARNWPFGAALAMLAMTSCWPCCSSISVTRPRRGDDAPVVALWGGRDAGCSRHIGMRRPSWPIRCCSSPSSICRSR